MNLILVRHAEAVPHGTTDDELRELTPHGRIQAATLAAALAARGVTAGAIVSSPLVRARQTAEALAERFTDGRVTETPYLSIDKFKKRKLTALAAILAMIPLSRSTFWGPMAVVIMGGLFVATFLTLLFLPALYALWFRRSLGAHAPRPKEEAEAAAAAYVGAPAE